jgi:TRAP-type C4-dicarboxylate transport system substrate-binding protein
VTFSQAVPDSQVYSCNLEWFNALPGDVRDGIVFASDITAQQNLAKVPAARNYAMAEMGKAGVQFYSPSTAELTASRKSCPARSRPSASSKRRQTPRAISTCDSFKKELSGSLATFGKLEEAANTQSHLYVHDA